MKKKIIIALVIIIPVIITAFFIADWNDKLSYSKCVGECENTELVNRCLEKGAAYEIGVNARGMPIFKDKKAALEQAQSDYKLGFDYLYRYEKLPVLSGKPLVCFQYFLKAMNAHPPMTVKDYETIKAQCIEIACFFDIYLNSFKPIP